MITARGRNCWRNRNEQHWVRDRWQRPLHTHTHTYRHRGSGESYTTPRSTVTRCVCYMSTFLFSLRSRLPSLRSFNFQTWRFHHDKAQHVDGPPISSRPVQQRVRPSVVNSRATDARPTVYKQSGVFRWAPGRLRVSRDNRAHVR